MRVKDLAPDEIESLRKIRAEKVRQKPGSVALSIGGKAAPLIIRDTEHIILGRKVDGSPPPTVDLNQFSGFALGVSRHHALIKRTENGGYTVEDLSSTNGTWLNDTRLIPHKPYILRSGDHVRVGQLLIAVHF